MRSHRVSEKVAIAVRQSRRLPGEGAGKPWACPRRMMEGIWRRWDAGEGISGRRNSVSQSEAVGLLVMCLELEGYFGLLCRVVKRLGTVHI